MKKYFLKITSLFLFVAVLTSCDEDKVFYDTNNGQSLVGFNTDRGNLPTYAADAGSDFILEFEVGSSVKVNHDRTFAIAVNDQFTTAIPSQYALQQTTFVIPANEFVGTVKIKGNYDALPTLGQTTVTYDLVSVDGADVINPDSNTFTVTIYRACPIEIPLAYTGLVVGSVGAGAPQFDVTFTAVSGADNTWRATNLWGNFVTAATGTNYDGQYPYPGTVKINCDNTVTVVGTGSVGNGGKGTYNPTTKVINISLNQSLFTGSFTADIELTPKQ